MKKATVVSILSNFGFSDSRLALLKASLLSFSHPIHLLDICHTVPSNNPAYGAYLLWTAVASFPPGSIHLVLAGMSEAKDERLVCVQAGGQTFLGADNGILWPAIERFSSYSAHQIEKNSETSPSNQEVLCATLSHILNEVPKEDWGQIIPGIEPFELFKAKQQENEITGSVLFESPEGHLITDISSTHFRDTPNLLQLHISVGPFEIRGISTEVSPFQEGEAVATFNYAGLLEIQVVGCKASTVLNLKTPQFVVVRGTFL